MKRRTRRRSSSRRRRAAEATGATETTGTTGATVRDAADAPARRTRRRRAASPTPAKRRRRQRKNAPRRVVAPAPDARAARARAGSPRRRLVAALLVTALLLVAVVVRIGFLQMGNADELRSAGTEQWTRTLELPARRGTIFDRHGNELAMSVPAAAISINPQLVEDGEGTLAQLDALLDLPDEKVEELATEIELAERGFVYVARQADAQAGEEIVALDLPGVNVDTDARRELTGGDSARNLLGTVDVDGVGTAGLEVQYDELLAGNGGVMTREIAPGGRTIAGSESMKEAPVAGDDLVLTIDRSIQHVTEQLLLEQVQAIPARGGQAIVMDTDTGEVYAMASVRREPGEGVSVTPGNYALVEAYEPGSVAKVVTIAGALDSGAVTPETGFEVPWQREYFDVVLSDSHQHATEWMDVWKILVTSSNIGTIEIQRTMGSDVHHQYMQDFGWGRPTGLDFPSESAGHLKPFEDMWGSEMLTPSYGQGVATSPAQLIAAINTVPNDGVYVAPKLVKSTIDERGDVSDTEESTSRRVISRRAARQTSEIMRDVVCRGTATRAQVEGITVAGKTGTAFKATDNGTYVTDEGGRLYYASFVGYFPAEDPEVTVLVSIDEPAATNERFGGTAAAPVFADLVPVLVNELGIQPPAGGGCPEE